MKNNKEYSAQKENTSKNSAKKKYVSPTVVAVSTSNDQQALQINACDSFIP